jgi:hypothetical protein
VCFFPELPSLKWDMGIAQVRVTAQDEYANVITAGDAGFTLSNTLLAAVSPGSLVRTVAAGVTTFQFTIAVASTYIVRIETASGALVHQSKLQIVPGSVSYQNSRYLNLPATAQAGQALIGYVQIRDAQSNVFREGSVFSRFVLTAQAQAGPETGIKVCTSTSTSTYACLAKGGREAQNHGLPVSRFCLFDDWQVSKQ